MKLYSMVWLLFILTVNGDDEKSTFLEKQKWLQKIIPDDYDDSINPFTQLNQSGKFIIKLLFFAYGVTDINIAKMEFEVDVGVGLAWEDKRLLVDHRPKDSQQTLFKLPQNIASTVWTPSAFFPNQKQTGKAFLVGSGTEQLRLKVPEKEILFWQRQLVKFRCYYHLQKYPFDSHKCSILFRADGRDNRDTYRMKVEYVPLLPWGDFPTMVKNRMPPEYELIELISVPKDCGDDLGGTPDSCVSINFSFRRITSHHMMLTYIPSMLIVVLSWLSFWLDVDCTAPRVSLGLTSMLTLATQFGNAQKNLPAVAYVKAIDVWMINCVFMVFATLLEYSIAYQVHKNRLNWFGNVNFGSAKEVIKKVIFPSQDETNIASVSPTILVKECEQMPIKKDTKLSSEPTGKKKTNVVDKIARIFFPTAFAIFNLIYWLVYVA